ncbi:MAG: cupin domain-containing protein [Clostridiales bacterium]|nr:cupin domain-containing protein [Clostridiales bacterium]
MEKLIKNMEHSTVSPLAEQVQYLDGQIVSKTLAQSKHHSLTLFAFDQGEEISSHDSEGDAMILALDGKGKVTIDGVEHPLETGESIIMPAQIPHAVFATERFKMMLTVIFSEKS